MPAKLRLPLKIEERVPVSDLASHIETGPGSYRPARLSAARVQSRGKARIDLNAVDSTDRGFD